MPKLKILVGPPGSGKSYYAKCQEESWRGSYVRVSQDDQGKEGHQDKFRSLVRDNYNIILDRMNFDKKQRQGYIKIAKDNGYDVECIIFHTPKVLCNERAAKRLDHPTIKDPATASKVINFFFAKYEKPEFLEGFSSIISITPDINKQDAIVIDLDGTLCNIDHRLHHVRNKPKRWDLFFKEIPNDKTNTWCQEIYHKFRGQYDVLFCSGRGEEYRKETELWLAKNIAYGPWDLFMRPAGDSRPDDIIKETILDFDILPQYKPLFFIDDRKRVVDMWRRRGFVCLQCADGNF